MVTHSITTISTRAPSEITTPGMKTQTSQYAITQNITMSVLSTTSETSTENENNRAPSYDIAFMDTMTYVSIAKATTRKNVSNDAFLSSTGGVTVVIFLFALLSLFQRRLTSDY